MMHTLTHKQYFVCTSWNSGLWIKKIRQRYCSSLVAYRQCAWIWDETTSAIATYCVHVTPRIMQLLTLTHTHTHTLTNAHTLLSKTLYFMEVLMINVDNVNNEKDNFSFQVKDYRFNYYFVVVDIFSVHCQIFLR